MQRFKAKVATIPRPELLLDVDMESRPMAGHLSAQSFAHGVAPASALHVPQLVEIHLTNSLERAAYFTHGFLENDE
jgi:hypothetical protein